MAIQVTCPSCLKRFSVSDKFAGRTGPCPSCEKPINIPELTDEVVIHAPEDSGPKDSAGVAVLKPIRRKEVSLSLPVILGAAFGAFALIAVAFGMGLSGEQPATPVLVIGSLLLAPPLVLVGYWFLHNDELEGFRGRGLLIRCGICSLAFAFIWGIYGHVPGYVSGYSSMSETSGLDLIIFVPLMIILGTIVSVAALELEVVQGFMHYVLYLSVTLLLAWLAGAKLASPLGSGPGDPAATPPATAPANPGDTQTPEEPGEPNIPNMLQ